MVRWFEHDGRRAAGLVFTDLDPSDTTAVAEEVRRVLPWDPDEHLSAEALFGDLALEEAPSSALHTADVVPPGVPAFVLRTLDLELPLLQQLLDGDAADGPDWLVTVKNDLTAIEAAAVRGRACSPWIHRAVRLRLHFAQAERMPKGRQLPSSLLDEAYRTFEHLKQEMDGGERRERGAAREDPRRPPPEHRRGAQAPAPRPASGGAHAVDAVIGPADLHGTIVGAARERTVGEHR